jgi:seryl-tRNA synthetase
VISSVASLFLAVLGQAPARAQEQASQTPDIQQMQKKLEQLEKELLELRQQMNAAVALSKESVPGPSIPVTTDDRQAEEHSEQPKLSSSVNFYGFVMMDSGFNFGAINPDWFDVERPTQLPALQGEYGADGNAFSGVRLSRDKS